MAEGDGEQQTTGARSATPDVFVSYASQDAGSAKRICDALRAAGVEVWFDQSELRGGEVWDRQIRQQIHECRLFMPIVSANTEARVEGYFRREWKLAVDRTHDLSERVAFLVPIVIDSTPEAKSDVPDAFRHVQWTRLPGGTATPAFVERIRRLITPVPAPALPAAATPPEYTSAQLSTTTNGPHGVARVALWVLSGVVALGLAYFVVERFWLSKHTSAERPAAAAAPALPPPAAAIPDKSVAVLPFADMSEKKDQEYFSDGMAEEIIDLLVKVPDLHVPARTSSFYFKGKSEDIPTIAKRLMVANVLEGSVRRSGNHLRVTAQLVRADNGYHLWSETYDRQLDDVFKVQDEIASAVVNALKVSLLQGEPKRAVTAKNADVYTAYLQSKFFSLRNGYGDNQRAFDYVHEALRLDPTFGPAWAFLSRLIIYDWEDGHLAFKQAREEAQRAAERALSLDPKLPEAHLALGRISFYMDWNWSAADTAFRKALDLDPDSADALHARAQLLATLGRLDEALQLENRANARDPLNWIFLDGLGWTYVALGRFSEGELAFRKAINLNPAGETHSTVALILLLRGDPAAALLESQKDQPSATPDYTADVDLAMIYHALGRDAESDAALARAEKKFANQPGAIAVAHAYRGEADQAFLWLERGYRQHYWGMLFIKRQPLLKNIEGDPRFKALLRKMNLPE